MSPCIAFAIFLQMYLTHLISGYQIVSHSTKGCYSDYTENPILPKHINLNLSCDASHIVHIVGIIYMRPSTRGDKICNDSSKSGCCKFNLNQICFENMLSNNTNLISASQSCQNKSKCVINLERFHMEACSTEDNCRSDWFEQDGSCWSRTAEVAYVCYVRSG